MIDITEKNHKVGHYFVKYKLRGVPHILLLTPTAKKIEALSRKPKIGVTQLKAVLKKYPGKTDASARLAKLQSPRWLKKQIRKALHGKSSEKIAAKLEIAKLSTLFMVVLDQMKNAKDPEQLIRVRDLISKSKRPKAKLSSTELVALIQNREIPTTWLKYSFAKLGSESYDEREKAHKELLELAKAFELAQIVISPTR